jgi:hypothetical protein
MSSTAHRGTRGAEEPSAIVVPLLFYPFAKMLWAALDFLIYRSDPDHSASDRTERGPDPGGNSA